MFFRVIRFLSGSATINSFKRKVVRFINERQINFLDYLKWHMRGFPAPLPNYIKLKTLYKNALPKGVWIESGTYYGETTNYLSKRFRHIYTVEPQIEIFFEAKKILDKYPNVDIYNETSTQALPKILDKVTGDINFWLDGHFSGENTYFGDGVSPISQELQIIESIFRSGKLKGNLKIFVDDVRLFGGQQQFEKGYPDIDFLIFWAKSNGFRWYVQNDIFIMDLPHLKGSS